VLFLIITNINIIIITAAETMYWRVIRLGEKGRGREALEEQRKSYLDVLICLRLVVEKEFRYVVRSLGGINHHQRAVLPDPEVVTCFDGTTVRIHLWLTNVIYSRILTLTLL